MGNSFKITKPSREKGSIIEMGEKRGGSGEKVIFVGKSESVGGKNVSSGAPSGEPRRYSLHTMLKRHKVLMHKVLKGKVRATTPASVYKLHIGSI